MTVEEAIGRIKEHKEIHYAKEPRAIYISVALDMAISALEKQIPKKPYTDNENGVYEKEYCPTCHSSLFPNDHHCRCGQKIDWSDSE